MSGGSAGGGGYNYQADGIAYVDAFILAQQPLGWIEHFAPDVPVAVAVETGGPGDDFQIILRDGTRVEVQAKRGLKRDHRFWEAIVRLASGLANDSSLQGILLVDSTSCRPITRDLSRDFRRLADGRNDGLKQITTELLDKLAAHRLTDLDVFKRARVIVCDLAESESGAAAARAHLARVLLVPGQAPAAFRILAKDGLDLIQRRGRRDAEALVQLLSRACIPLRSDVPNVAVAAERYRRWLVDRTDRFYVPGLGVDLAITDAWIKLEVLDGQGDQQKTSPETVEARIDSYHRRERVPQDYQHSSLIDAEHLAEFTRLVVVIGGPGAGKSTLQRRLANRLAKRSKNVLLVRLKLVSERMEAEGFDDALLQVATDGCGMTQETLELPLSDVGNYLLADGLDECDPNRHLVAQALSDRSCGHPRARLVVTTRPVGHEPALLPGWRHFELLPLNQAAIREHANRLFLEISGRATRAQRVSV